MRKTSRLLICLGICFFFGVSFAARDPLAGSRERIEKHRKKTAALLLRTAGGSLLEAGTKVRIEQTGHAFLFGSNLFALDRLSSGEENELYRRRFADVFNFATLPFYWWAYERSPGHEDRERIAWMLDFCRRHRILAKGHPLAWNFRDPSWLPADPEAALEAQPKRIESVASEFRGKIAVWDVVNEATRFDREETRRAAPLLTTAISAAGRGKYLREAFARARRGDPDATLIINDYWTGPEYGEEVIDLLVDSEGQPLYDAIGIQSHQHRGAWGPEKTWEVAERFAAYRRPLHFTETTFLSGEPGWELKGENPGFAWVTTPEGEARQAKSVEEFYRLLFSHPRVEAITWWDLSDQEAWQGAPAGLLRSDLTPKPVYEVLLRLIKQEWWTRLETAVESDGRVRFRGFFGDYRLTVETPQGTFVATFGLKKAGPSEVELTLSPAPDHP